ncbi:hypothetical protein D3C72_2546050 [compost metagenome]
MLASWQVFHVVILVLMTGLALARSFAGRLHARRRVTFDNVMLVWLYTCGQGVVSLLLVHLFPRLAV